MKKLLNLSLFLIICLSLTSSVQRVEKKKDYSILKDINALNTYLTMTEMVDQNQRHAQLVFSGIRKRISERGNQEKEIRVLEEALKLNKKCELLFTFLKETEDEIIKKTGGYEADAKTPKGLIETSVVQKYFFDGSSETPSVKGKKLLADLDAVIHEFNLTDDVIQVAQGKPNKRKIYKKLTKNGKAYQLSMDDEEWGTANYLQLAFEEVNVISCLVTLTQLKAAVVMNQHQILKDMQNLVGAAEFSFDNFTTMVNAESKVVGAGSTYSAKIFLGTTSSDMIPKVVVDSQELKVSSRGVASIKFKAEAGDSTNEFGQYDKTWEADLYVKLPDGRDTTIHHVQPYKVSPAYVNVNSLWAQSLYRKCGNELVIQVPSLDKDFSPRYSAIGAIIRPHHSNKNKITIIPAASSEKVVLDVSSGKQKLAKYTFQVRDIPSLEVIPYVNGQEVDLMHGIDAPESIILKSQTSDSLFNVQLAKDARFKITKGEAHIVRGAKSMAKIPFKGSKINLGSYASRIQAGDRIYIKVSEVERYTYLGTSITMKPNYEINIPVKSGLE